MTNVKIEAVSRGFFQTRDRIAAPGRSSTFIAVTTVASMPILIRALSITRTSPLNLQVVLVVS
jgi:hypothetical protein